MANPVKNLFPEIDAGVDFTCFVDIHRYQQPVENPGVRAAVCLPVSLVENIFFYGSPSRISWMSRIGISMYEPAVVTFLSSWMTP